MTELNKVQINYTVRKDSEDKVMDRSTMINIREDNPQECMRLYNSLKAQLNGELKDKANHISNNFEQSFNNTNDNSDKICPDCHIPLVVKISKNGKTAGQKFYACSNYPSCKQTMPV